MRKILDFLARLFVKKPKPMKAKRIVFLNEEGERTTMEIIGPDMKKVFTARVVDAKGRDLGPAVEPIIDGIPSWSVEPTGIVALFPIGPDNVSCEAVWLAPGNCVLTANADADAGAGVRTISGSADIQTTPSAPAALALTAGPEIPV